MIKGIVVTPFKIISPGYVAFKEGIIEYVGGDKPRGEILDYTDHLVTPGFIDIHTHGGGGNDVQSGKRKDLEGLSKFLARGGVTSFLATLSTTHIKRAEKVADSIKKSIGKVTGARLLGLHMEGPYINPRRKGAQSEKHIREPEVEELEEIIETSVLRIVSLAPEMRGATEMIRWLKYRDVVVAGGHSDASYREAEEGIEAGITHMIHLFNGMRGFHHREPGIVGASLTYPRVSVEVIADGIHLHPVSLQLTVKLKGVRKTVLVSDSLPPAGLPEGVYNFGEKEVILKDDECRLRSGVIAGSTIRLNEAIRNMVELTGLGVTEAVSMATDSPSKVIGVEDRKGRLLPGFDADITVLKRFEPVLTIVGGETVYKRESPK